MTSDGEIRRCIVLVWKTSRQGELFGKIESVWKVFDRSFHFNGFGCGHEVAGANEATKRVALALASVYT